MTGVDISSWPGLAAISEARNDQRSSRNPDQRSEAKEHSGFTGSLLKNQSRQPQANRTALNLNQSGCWKRSGEFAEEKKKSKVTHRPAMLAVDIKKKLNDELVVLISWLYPSL